MGVCTFKCRCLRGQKSASDPLELKLQVVVSCQMEVLETELRSSAEAECAFHCQLQLAQNSHTHIPACHVLCIFLGGFWLSWSFFCCVTTPAEDSLRRARDHIPNSHLDMTVFKKQVKFRVFKTVSLIFSQTITFFFALYNSHVYYFNKFLSHYLQRGSGGKIVGPKCKCGFGDKKIPSKISKSWFWGFLFARNCLYLEKYSEISEQNVKIPSPSFRWQSYSIACK